MRYPEATTTAPPPLRVGRKIVVAVIGATVLAVGVTLIVLPGPAVVVIPLGLAILATEFVWARRLLRRLHDGATRLLRRPIRRHRFEQGGPTEETGTTEKEWKASS